MNPKIRTYEELLEEEKRLLAILKGHESLMRQDIVGVRQGLKPVNNVFNFVSKLSTRDQTGPFANFGLEFGLDLLLRRFLLARAGWFTKIAIPYLVKNYASHIITEEKRDILIGKLNTWMQKFRPKPPASASYSAQDVDPRFYRPGFTGNTPGTAADEAAI